VGAANPKAPGLSNVKSGAVDVKGRIDRLENLVRSMISGDGSTESESPPTFNKSPSSQSDHQDGLPSRAKQLTPSSGAESVSPRSHIDGSGITGRQKVSIDTRSTHWDVILNDVSLHGLSCDP